MGEVKRFSVGFDGVDPNGNLVRYVDYAALEQRAEAAEAALAEEKRINSKLREDRAGLARKCNAFEAQLAELEKQEPVAMRYRWAPPHMRMPDGSQFYGDWKLVADSETANPGKDYERVNLYARPAPAINLAELVPAEDEGWQTDEFKSGRNSMRSEILRNIEEQSKILSEGATTDTRAAPPAPFKLPEEKDRDMIAHVYLDETTIDKPDAYVKGFNACLAEVIRINK